MTDTPIRLAGLRGTLASFAGDLFVGRVGCVTDAPMCTGGRDRWGICDGSAWHLGPASDYAGNSNVLSLAVNGTETIDSARNVKAATLWSGGAIRADANGDFTGRNQTLTGTQSLIGVSGGNSILDWVVGGNRRFALFRNNTAESGGNVGSQLVLNAYDDSGNFVDSIFVATRVAGSTFRINRNVLTPKGVYQWSSEPVTSARYVKTSDTTIGPGATAKASLLNGGVAAGGFAAVTDPAGRWNLVGAQSDTTLIGKVSTVANQVLVFELYRNGAVAATLTTPARTYSTVTPWRLVIDQDVRVSGSSGTVRVDMRFHATADNTNAQASCYQMDATLTGIDLTAAQSWDVVCTIPNNAANSITCTKAKKVG